MSCQVSHKWIRGKWFREMLGNICWAQMGVMLHSRLADSCPKERHEQKNEYTLLQMIPRIIGITESLANNG